MGVLRWGGVSCCRRPLALLSLLCSGVGHHSLVGWAALVFRLVPLSGNLCPCIVPAPGERSGWTSLVFEESDAFSSCCILRCRFSSQYRPFLVTVSPGLSVSLTTSSPLAWTLKSVSGSPSS